MRGKGGIAAVDGILNIHMGKADLVLAFQLLLTRHIAAAYLRQQ